jgi:RNA polymerase sigma-70 factor (ECF subfamily)
MQAVKDIAESDEAIMLNFQQGDPFALEILVRRHADALLGFLVRMCRDRSQAEDLFQETFLRVQSRAHQFKPGRRFKSWLYAIAAHLAVDHQRRSRWRSWFSLDDAPMQNMSDHRPDPSQAAASEDRKRQVRAALDRLPARQKATLVLAYFEDLTYPEVAATMGCSVGTVKTQVSRALHTLAGLLPDPAAGGAS